MNCQKCNALLGEEGNCTRCSAAQTEVPNQEPDAWSQILGVAAVLGAAWLGKKILKSRGVGESTFQASGVGALPPEFQEQRSRLCTEIPGQPEVSAMQELHREAQKRQYHTQIGQMWIDHAKTMNKILLGLK
jgi:hypothetical protein